MEKILIVNVNWLGDVLFSTPLMRAVRERFPDAYIASMIVPRCKEVLELNPHLNGLIIYDEDGSHRGLSGKIRFISELRSKRFDTAILLSRSFTRALMLFFAGIPRRIGYYTRKRSFLLTDAVGTPAEETHRVDFFLSLGRPLGISIDSRDYEFFISDEDRKNMKSFLNSEGIRDMDIVVVINPGGNWDPKRWPKENFARLTDELIDQYKARIVITGAKKDLGLAEAISSMMKERPLIACGRTSLKEAAAIFERANLVISNDSGPMHIAVAMGANTLALFGPTSPRITGPIGRGKYIVLQKRSDCEIPCYDLSCADYRCMEAITVEDVLGAARKLLK